jgi:murein DD-endopeptidase MepM/ murein hydrolase activator NlpD
MLNAETSYTSHIRCFAWLCLSFFCFHQALASEIYLDGEFVQGGLVQGTAPPGSLIILDGHKIRVSSQGAFLVGFGRDDVKDVVLEVRLPSGTVERHNLKIRARHYKIQRIDGLPPNKVTPDESVLARIEKESALVRATRRRDDDRTDFLTGFVWPTHGRISGVYGSQRILNGEPRQPHYGVDVAAPVGTKVLAPADGIVTLAHDDLYFSGGTLILDHGHGLSSAFLHLSHILVKVDDVIRRGEPIAEVGATGRVTGAHLDWRMNLFDKRIDPALLVEPMTPE